MVHHMQYLDNSDYITRVMRADQDDVSSDAELEEVEGEAYLKGNLILRKKVFPPYFGCAFPYLLPPLAAFTGAIFLNPPPKRCIFFKFKNFFF